MQVHGMWYASDLNRLLDLQAVGKLVYLRHSSNPVTFCCCNIDADGAGEDTVMNSSAKAAETADQEPQQQQQQQQEHQVATEQSAAEQTAAAEATAEAVAAASAAAEAASGAVVDMDEANQESGQPAQLSYAAIREAEAVNQAADSAADEAMRTVAAAQQTMHLLMNPVQPAMSSQHGMSMEDDAGNSTHHPSGRARRSRSASGYMDHHAHMMGMGHGGGMYGGGRPNKGLRHFSMKVCEKVESKGTTSYNEVADELVAELKDGGLDDGICYDEKNIRRRVYDAINVLMALDIIAKEKKAIIWKGFPTSRTPAQQVGSPAAQRPSLLPGLIWCPTWLL
jgi:hypothetical protein